MQFASGRAISQCSLVGGGRGYLRLETVAGPQSPAAHEPWTAPEVAAHGLSTATPASDVYSLCAVLLELFNSSASEVRAILSLGLEAEPARRPGAAEIADALEAEAKDAAKEPVTSAAAAPVLAALWDEGYVFTWRDYRYRVVAVLGRGSAGRTFKLERLVGKDDDPIGAFVGKAVLNPDVGAASLDAYRQLIRTPDTKLFRT